MIVGITEAAQDISFPAMVERQQALMDIVLKDPAIARLAPISAPAARRRRSIRAACSSP